MDTNATTVAAILANTAALATNGMRALTVDDITAALATPGGNVAVQQVLNAALEIESATADARRAATDAARYAADVLSALTDGYRADGMWIDGAARKVNDALVRRQSACDRYTLFALMVDRMANPTDA